MPGKLKGQFNFMDLEKENRMRTLQKPDVNNLSDREMMIQMSTSLSWILDSVIEIKQKLDSKADKSTFTAYDQRLTADEKELETLRFEIQHVKDIAHRELEDHDHKNETSFKELFGFKSLLVGISVGAGTFSGVVTGLIVYLATRS